jgi:signal transduction histidine kinase
VPRTLSSRIVLAFALVIVFSLTLSAIGTLFLLRDKERESAEERVGRLAVPLNLAVALLEQRDVSQAEVQSVVLDYAQSFDVRVLLVDANGRVVFDSQSRLAGSTVDVLLEPAGDVTKRGSAEFRMAKYDADGDELLLFTPPADTLELSTNRIIQLQTLIYLTSATGSSTDFAELIRELASQPDSVRTLPLPQLRPIVAVSESEISSAWQDIVPPLAIAGAIALLASAVVAVLLARSVTGRLASVTRAAQEMAVGNYDQHLDVRGQDEVARLAKAFNAMATEVSGSHRMMRDLLANVSHELRTPLTSIQGFSQALEENAIGSDEEYRQAGRIINEEAQRMRQLVDDLIDLSRLESGEIVMQREPVDLQELLRDCAGRFEWQVRQSGAKIEVDVPQLPQIEGDSRRLEQAFSNLIDNAVRHAGRDGAVSVRAESHNGIVRVGVHNTGSFIPQDELARVFERFFQVDRNRSRQGGGAGLGLAIASEVVQAHAGTIGATSDREQGTEFFVELPLRSGTRNKGPGTRN